MDKHHNWFLRIVCALSILVLMFSFSGMLSVQAQEPQPACIKDSCPPGSGGGDVTAQKTANLKLFTKITQKGYYASTGVGMRNLGYATLNAPVLPTNSTITNAYLFWTVIGPKNMKVPDPNNPTIIRSYNYAKGFIQNTAGKYSITGALIGSDVDPWFFGSQTIFAYRADVKSYIKKSGGGTYALSGFASGATNGGDPNESINDVMPLLDGASLVVIYSNPNYPTFTIQIYNGAATLPAGNYLHLSIPGVNAVAPTGYAFTTFIGADGWNTASGSGNFFETPLPAVAWNGAVPNGNGSSYPHGNLWDDVQVDLHAMLNPPENEFWFSTTKVWSITWVAQVLAYSDGSQDTDGDGLLDGWELNGVNGINLPGMGASPLHKDLFVEADYMKNPNDSNVYLPPVAQLNDIVSVFNNAPVNDPDGTTGIWIHIDTGGADETSGPGTYSEFNLGGGNQVPYEDNLGSDTSTNCSSYNWTDFQNNYKNKYFNALRAPIFHYMVFANDLASCMGTTSGISRNGWPDSVFIKGATDFIVSLGDWSGHGSATDREGTFIHELGHNLGLRHGGNDNVNYKPNYVSVMNYLYQTAGVWRNGGIHYDYSRIALAPLNESALHENKGLGTLALPDGYGAIWYCPNGSKIGSSTYINGFDWNCSGGIQTTAIKADINYSGTYSSLASSNNWASITFKGGGIIGNALAASGVSAQGPSITYWVDELKEGQVPSVPWGPQP